MGFSISMGNANNLKDKTARGLVWGGFSNVTQQLLNLVFGVWLSRILNVEDYGTIGVLTIFTLIATTLQESGFTQAVTNKKNATHRDFNSIFWCSSFIGVFLYIILFFCAPFIASFFNSPNLVALSRFLFLGFVFSSLGTAHNAYLFKHMMVKERAISMITGLFVSGIVGVTLAYQGYAYWGLACQHLAYIICTNLLFGYFTKWKPTLEFSFAPIKEMFSFSYKILITKICIHLNNHIFNIILGRLFSKKEVGYFTQANKWNLMGSSVITEMIQGVAQPLFKNVNDDKTLKEQVFLKMMRFTAFITFPALLGLAFVAPEFIEILLTDKWSFSASLLSILCLGGTFLPLNNLMSNLIISTGKSSIYMWNSIALVALQLISALFLYPFGIKSMIASFVVLQFVWFFVWYYFAQRIISISLLKLLREVVPYALITCIVIAITNLTVVSIDNIYLLLSLKVILVTVLYFTILFFGKFSILTETIYQLKRIIFKRDMK